MEYNRRSFLINLSWFSMAPGLICRSQVSFAHSEPTIDAQNLIQHSRLAIVSMPHLGGHTIANALVDILRSTGKPVTMFNNQLHKLCSPVRSERIRFHREKLGQALADLSGGESAVFSLRNVPNELIPEFIEKLKDHSFQFVVAESGMNLEDAFLNYALVSNLEQSYAILARREKKLHKSIRLSADSFKKFRKDLESFRRFSLMLDTPIRLRGTEKTISRLDTNLLEHCWADIKVRGPVISNVSNQKQFAVWVSQLKKRFSGYSC